ncbi:hypothetical protein G6F62_014189 [Rhizopus arrhizus]|nr:hypothetical protein G6F62_014189 [Rhizopus arrhizus]
MVLVGNGTGIAGLRSLLFLGVPTPEQLRRAGPLDALGIAGAARAMAPDQMEAELRAVGRFMAGTGARVLHYKCCSTFDSAPHVGTSPNCSPARAVRPRFTASTAILS